MSDKGDGETHARLGVVVGGGTLRTAHGARRRPRGSGRGGGRGGSGAGAEQDPRGLLMKSGNKRTPLRDPRLCAPTGRCSKRARHRSAQGTRVCGSAHRPGGFRDVGWFSGQSPPAGSGQCLTRQRRLEFLNTAHCHLTADGRNYTTTTTSSGLHLNQWLHV